MTDPWVCMEGMRRVWVRNLFSQSKMVNIVIILNIIDTHTTTQDNPYPSLRVWVCMGMGKGRGENTHGLPMSHTISNNWVPQPGVPPYDGFQLGPLGQQHLLPLIVGIHTFYSANWLHCLLFQISDQHPDMVFRYQPKDKVVNGAMVTPPAINFRCLHLIQQVQTAVWAGHIME